MTKGDRLGHSWREGRLLYPGLASDFANMIRAALALYEATGQGGYLDQRAGLAARVRRALRQSGQRRLFPHRRRRRGAGGAAGLDQRRRHAQSERHRRAKSGPARGADRRHANGASRPTGCSTACWRARPTTCSQHAALLNALDLRLHAAEIVVTGPDHARFAAAALKLPYRQPRSCCARRRPKRCRPSIRRRPRLRRARAARRSSASGETCSLPVTDPDEIADAVAAMRPARV